MSQTTKRKKRTTHKPAQKKLSIGLPTPPRERWDEFPPLAVYVFDERHRLLACAPVEKDGTQVPVDFGRARVIKAILGPQGLPPGAVRRSSLPSLAVEAKTLDRIEFPLGWWEQLILGQFIFYRGRVEKVIGDATLPIGEGVVECYEIDPFQWIVIQPEFEIRRFRDDLLKLLDKEFIEQVRPPWPEPGPGPGPGPDPGPLMKANPVLPGAPAEEMFANSELPPSSANARVKALPQTSLLPTDLVLLRNLEGPALRNWFGAHKDMVFPLLCALRPDWWYSKDKLGEVPIQPDGSFHGFAGWWTPGLDRPDLYFRVRQTIEGADKYILAPPIACNTWWNYTGDEVVLRVTDSEAIAHSDPLVAEDDQVVFLGVGFDTTTDVVTAPGLVQTGTDIGLFRYPSGKVGPYARKLHVSLDVDLEGLADAGVSFFRFSWRKGHHVAYGSASDWTPITTPLARHYREVTVGPGGPVVSYPVVSLVPAPAAVPAVLTGVEGLFGFPEPGRDYVVIKRADRSFATWDTEALPAEGQSHGDVADLYTLRLELFNATGNDITATTPLLRIQQELPDDSFATTNLPADRPFLYVHVDNRPMVAEVADAISVGTSSTGTGCGFLQGQPSANVKVGIKAYHPGGLGFPGDPDRFIEQFRYRVRRGAAALTRVDETVTDKSVGTPATFHTVPYAPDIPLQTVDHLLDGVVVGAGRPRRCTFGVHLGVHTTTRNGYGILNQLDRWDSASFALIEQRP